MNQTKKLRVAVCASASLYDQLIALSNHIDSAKVEIILPAMAKRIKDGSLSDDEASIDWSKTSYDYKAELIRGHFTEIEKCDAVLVTNFAKNGQENYIGGNVLMEMTVAFYLKKPILVLNAPPEYSPLIDEIMGIQPVFLHGEVKNIVPILRKIIN